MTDQQFIDQLKRHEGVRQSAYQDSLGYWTIGVGRLIDGKKGGKLSMEEIEYLLRNDIKRTCEEVRKALPWFDSLSTNRQQVLINMGFNLGTKGLLGFKNTLEFVRTGQYDAAAKGMLASKWAKQVGNRSVELAEQMRNG